MGHTGFVPNYESGIDKIQEYRKLYSMKVTLDIPDELYRKVKARSAMEGRPVRSVAVELFQNWLAEPLPDTSPASKITIDRPPTRFDNAPWLAITAQYAKPGSAYDPEGERAAIAAGWAAEAAEKLGLAPGQA